MDHHLLKQAKKFLLTSGIGWLIDFTIYSYITSIWNINVLYANIISSIPAITFVFFISTKKTFSNESKKISLKIKYIIYIGYQFILLLIISNLGQWLFDWMIQIPWISIFLGSYIKLFIKILITPITMTMNFFIMKYLIEKI